MTISRWIVPISGFTQSRSRSNGIDRLWLKVRDQANGTVSVVPPQHWNSDWEQWAGWISRMSRGEKPEVFIFAYSWGCGNGAIQLARELRSAAIDVKAMVFSDPVYHSWWRPWRAMVASPKILIPSNVGEVSWFRQQINYPRGTGLVSESTGTTIHEPITLHYDHQGMDDAGEFHDKCQETLDDTRPRVR